MGSILLAFLEFLPVKSVLDRSTTIIIFLNCPSNINLFQLREDFDSGADVILTDEVSVHDVATILKEFFRDLPEPLLPREVYHPLLAIQSKISRFHCFQCRIWILDTRNSGTHISVQQLYIYTEIMIFFGIFRPRQKIQKSAHICQCGLLNDLYKDSH